MYLFVYWLLLCFLYVVVDCIFICIDTAYLLSDVFEQVDTESFKAMIPSRGGFVCRNLGLVDCCSYWATCYQGNDLKFNFQITLKLNIPKQKVQSR